MTNGDILPPAILQHKAVVYVRQSTQTQMEPTPRAGGVSTSWSTSPGAGVSGPLR